MTKVPMGKEKQKLSNIFFSKAANGFKNWRKYKATVKSRSIS